MGFRQTIILPPVIKRVKRYNAKKASESAFTTSWNGYNLRSRNKLMTQKYKSRQQFIDINDDCMLHLFKFLNVTELLHLGMMSTRFAAFSVAHLSKAVLNIKTLARTFSPTQARKALQLFGKHIRRVNLPANEVNEKNWCTELFVGIVAEHCSNIEEVSLISKYVPIVMAKDLLQNCKYLYIRGSTLTEHDTYKIGRLPKLDLLSLRIPMVYGNYLTNLTNLICLELPECQIDPFNFDIICIHNQLQCLDITECHMLHDETFFNIVETQSKSLKTLNISFGYPFADISILCDLTSLQELCVIASYGNDPEEGFLEALAAKRKDTLKRLELHFMFTTTLSDSELNSILELRHLQTLCLLVFPITKEYLLKLAENLCELENLSVLTNTSFPSKLMAEIAQQFKKLKYCSMFYP